MKKRRVKITPDRIETGHFQPQSTETARKCARAYVDREVYIKHIHSAE